MHGQRHRLAGQQRLHLVDFFVDDVRDREVFGLRFDVGFAREDQEGVDDRFHVAARPLDATERSLAACAEFAFAFEKIRGDADHRQRRAQLVAGVSGEVSFARDERFHAFAERMQRLRELPRFTAADVRRQAMRRERIDVGLSWIPRGHFPREPVDRRHQAFRDAITEQRDREHRRQSQCDGQHRVRIHQPVDAILVVHDVQRAARALRHAHLHVLRAQVVVTDGQLRDTGRQADRDVAIAHEPALEVAPVRQLVRRIARAFCAK